MRATLLLACVLLSGCASTFNETHYFRESDPVTGDAVNYFRIDVAGHTTWARSRYVSGYYDERAVDLFFNEVKTDTATAADIKPIFSASLVDPGSTNKITPVSPGTDHGAFIMFFSSNTKAVSDAIGGFAENQVVADAITNILNRDVIRDQQRNAATQAMTTKRNVATSAELEALFAELPSTPAATDK